MPQTEKVCLVTIIPPRSCTNAAKMNVQPQLAATSLEVDRQGAVETLQKNDRMLATLLGNLPGAAYRSAADGTRTLEFISEGCRELTGYQPEAFVGDNKIQFGQLIHLDDRSHVDDAIQEARRQGLRFEVTYRISTAQGEERWIWDRGQLVPSEAGALDHIEGFMTDVTEKRRFEAQFLRAQRLESIGTLAGGIAHDLNNVLVPILMSIDLLKQRETDPRKLQILSSMDTSATRGADMVRQILGFARGVEGRRVPINPWDVLREIRQLLLETFPKNILCDVRMQETWGVEGDPTQLQQVLLNLCVNARDAMPAGGCLTVSANNVVVDAGESVATPGIKEGKYVVIEVEDTGTGIANEIKDKIFDPFFTTKEIGRGTGLGLSTSLAIVRSHQGFIDLTTTVGKGTTFKIYLPAKPIEAPESSSEAAPPKRGNNELILIVDDEPTIREIIRGVLMGNGYKVVSASDGEEALALFHSERPQLVITDIVMPNKDGVALIGEMKRIRPAIPIIGTSGMNNVGVAELTDLGMTYFLPKPFRVDALLNAVSRVLTDICTANRQANAHRNNELILVVEDEKEVLDTVSLILSEGGYRVATAVNGMEGLAFLERTRELPLLTFTDLMMPIMDGATMIRRMRAIQPQLRFIVTSGRPDAFPAELAKELGVQHFISKPCRAESLLRIIGSVLEESKTGPG